MATLPTVSCRWLLAGICFIYYFVVCMVRVNLSLVIVAMVGTTRPGNDTSVSIKNFNDHETYDWDAQLQGFILSSFYYGYLATQLPGGRLAEMIGAKRVMGWSLLLTTLLTILIPVGASFHYSVLIVLRVFQGLAEGPVFPAGRSLISKWVPPVERSRFTSIANSGCVLGTVICMWLSGTLIYYLGWKPVFYINGIIGLLAWVMWVFLVYDHPDEHPRISPEELKYLQKEIMQSKGVKKGLPAPMRKILTSIPVWTLVFCQAGKDWSYYCFSAVLPSYMHHILKFDIQSNGLLSGLPYLFRVFSGLAIAFLADWIRKHDWLSELNTRKLFTVTSFVIPGIILASVTRISRDPIVIVTLLVIAIGLSGGCSSAFSVLHLVICPNFAATTHGLATTAGSLTGLLSPVVVGYLTNEQQTVAQWEKVFWIAAGIYLATCAQFLVLGTDEVQSWNNPEKENSDENENEIQPRNNREEEKSKGNEEESNPCDIIEEKMSNADKDELQPGNNPEGPTSNGIKK